MIGYIYKTTDLTNNKIYVGKHKSTVFQGMRYVGSGTIITHIINKCIRESINLSDRLVVEMIDFADTDVALNEKEIYWIDKLNSRDPSIGYNLRKGGDCGPGGPMMLGKKHSEETRRKMSEARKGKNNSNYGKHRVMPESEKHLHACKGCNNGMYGKHHSAKTLDQLRIQKLGSRKMSNKLIYPKFKVIKPQLISEYLSQGWFFFTGVSK